MNFIDDNNLINSRADEVHSENAPLITLEYLLVRKLCGETTPKFNVALHNFFEECKIRDGLYNQRDFMEGNGCPEDYTSHDQLTALCCFSYLNGLKWHTDIWKEIKRQNYRYDNLNPDKKFLSTISIRDILKGKFEKSFTKERILHPRDIIFIGILNDVWWCRAAFPIFKKMMEMTCKKETETSGKLLAFVRCAAVLGRKNKFNVLFTKLTDIIRRNRTMNNWERVFEIYFPSKLHPTRKAIDKYRSANNWLR